MLGIDKSQSNMTPTQLFKIYETQAKILRKQGIFDEVKRIASIKTVKKNISKDKD